MFALGNATFACGVRSARELSFKESSGETEVWKMPVGAGDMPTGAADTPPARKSNPKLN